ncbi:MAG: helix-turn-helix domain-containing protein, partial [Gemmatimonadota bacterium]|nr:helix-turn-helix domain-containing protein [Gemmatimonadota bacterium]
RELRNTVERLLLLAAGPRVTAADVERLVLPRSASSADAASPLGGLEACATWDEFKRAAERAYLAHHLRRHGWNVAETARALEMPRSNLYAKIERHGLRRDAD